jgi:hypothetical protein
MLRSVSTGDVELARAFTNVFNSHDVEALISICHPQIEFHSTFAAVGGTVYRGHDGMRRWHGDLEDAWQNEIRSEPDAFFDLGEHTLTFTVLHGRGKQSGAEVVLPIAAVSKTRDGLLIYYKAYIHREDALNELGVSEESLEPIAP